MFRVQSHMLRCWYTIVPLLSGTLAAQNSLSPRQTLSSVSGQVVQESAGTPLRKVSIMLVRSEGSMVFSRQDNPEPHLAMTDSEGHFQMEGIQPGEYRVFLERNGFLAAPHVHATDNLSLSIELPLDPELQLARQLHVIKHVE